MTVKKIVFREASLGSVESLLLNLRLQSRSRIKIDVHEGKFSQKRTPTFSLSEILIFSNQIGRNRVQPIYKNYKTVKMPSENLTLRVHQPV